MSYQEILDKIKNDLDKIREYFEGQLMEIRAGRLSIGLIENIKVDCFGSILALKQIASFSNPSPREILVQLWDKSYSENVIRAIEKGNLDLGIRVEGNSIYLSAPSLTEDSKKNLIKVLNQKKEETFQNVRHIRDKAWKEIQEGFQKGELGEDEKYKGKDKLEELIKEHRDKIAQIAENKIKEIES